MGFEKMINFSPDTGAGGGDGSKEDEVSKKNQKIVDLNIVLAKVPHEVRENTDKYVEYRKNVDEARERLKEEGIDVDAYTKKDLQIGTEEGNKVYGQRKGELRAIVEKVAKGEDLSEEEKKILEAVNIKQENLQNIERQEAPKEINNPWDRAISIIEMQKDPAVRRSMRVTWVQKHLDDIEIPYYVIQEQSEKIYNDPGVVKNEDDKKKDRDFTEEEELAIIQNCLDQVFVEGKRSLYEIKKALLGGEGFIAVNLKHGEEVPLDNELLEKIAALGLDHWARVRDTVGRWAELKNTEEIKPSTLSSGMFLDQGSEKALANGRCYLPYKNEETGKMELREVDLGTEISKAMKIMREWFEGSINENGESTDPDRRIPREYWYLVGADLATKEEFYSKLKLNRYIGEAAFSLMLSYQMLTDTSTEDFMLMMVQQAKSRPNKYKINEERDPFCRMLVQEDMVKGEKPFTLFSGEEWKRRKAILENRLAKMLPSQLIPTGLSLGERDQSLGMSEGEIHLRAGDWLKWRANENMFTRAQYEGASKEDKKPATDQDTRLAMMQSALVVLMLIKEVQNPNSDIDKYNEMTGRLYSHVNASFRDAGWLIIKGVDTFVPADFSPLNENGEKEDMELREWVSRTMLTCGEMFMYTHSIADHKNPKPLDMWSFSQNAERILMFEPQSEKGSFIGMSERKRIPHRQEFIAYVDKLWDNCWEVIDAVNGKRKPDQYPKWILSGVSARQNVEDAAKKSSGSLSLWNRTKRNIK